MPDVIEPPAPRGHRQVPAATLEEIDCELLSKPLATLRSVAEEFGVSRDTVHRRRAHLIASGLLPKRSRHEYGALRNRARFAQWHADHPGTLRPQRRALNPFVLEVAFTQQTSEGLVRLGRERVEFLVPPIVDENSEAILVWAITELERAATRALLPYVRSLAPGGWRSAEVAL